MFDIYFILPNITNNPHSSAYIDNPGPKPVTHLENYFGHFDEFTFKNFVNAEFIPYIPATALKMVSVFVYLPQSAEFKLPKKLKKLINKDPTFYLCVFSVHEAQLHKGRLDTSLHQHGINPAKVIVVSSNFEMHQKVEGGVKHVFCNYWESYTRRCFRMLSDVSRITPAQRKDSLKDASKKYISLNRNLKAHRVWWYYSLCKSGLVNDGHVSYHLPDINHRVHNELINHPTVLEKLPSGIQQDFAQDFNRVCKAKSLDNISDKWLVNFQTTITDYYKDSVFSLITESDEKKNLLSEKTYKSIYHMHPFIIIGNPEQHQTLRERGYYTFEDFFGVDSVDNYTEALNLISKIKMLSLDEWKQKTYNIFDKLDHNLYNFINRTISWRDVEKEIIKAVHDFK